MLNLRNTKRTQRYRVKHKIPLSIGRDQDRQGHYAQTLIGYEITDRDTLRKINGNVSRFTDSLYTHCLKAVKHKDVYIAVFLTSAGTLSVLELSNAFSINNVIIGALTPDSTSPTYEKVDIASIDDYVFLSISGEVYMYSVDRNFVEFVYHTDPINDFHLSSVIKDDDGEAEGTIVSKGVGDVSEVIIKDVKGSFKKGMSITDDKGASHTIKKVSPADDYTVIFIDLADKLDIGDTVTKDSISGDIYRISDKITKGMWTAGNYYGIIEFTDNAARSWGSGLDDSGKYSLRGNATQLIKMRYAPQSKVISTYSYGGFTTLITGNINKYDPNFDTVGEGAAYYSEGWRVGDRVPFTNFQQDYIGFANSAGAFSNRTKGRLIDIIDADDYFISRYENGLVASRLKPRDVNKSLVNVMENFWTRDVTTYDVIRVPQGVFYVTKDGLYQANMGNSGGMVDTNITKILGDKLKEYNFENARLKYYRDKIYVMFNYCRESQSRKNSVLIFDTEFKTYSIVQGINAYGFIENEDKLFYLESNFNGGITEGEVEGVHRTYNTNALPTQLETIEWERDKPFYVNEIEFDVFGVLGAVLKVEVYGRSHGEFDLITEKIITITKDSGTTFFNSPVCSGNRGVKQRELLKVRCKDSVESIFIKISSNDDKPHELDDNIIIDYTLTKRRICQQD